MDSFCCDDLGILRSCSRWFERLFLLQMRFSHKQTDKRNIWLLESDSNVQNPILSWNLGIRRPTDVEISWGVGVTSDICVLVILASLSSSNIWICQFVFLNFSLTYKMVHKC
jgi:hypothetical protein